MPIQARTEFAAALNQIASEKGVDTDVIVSAIEDAALAAYRKDLTLRNEPVPDDFDDLKAKINPSTGEIAIMRGETNITPPGFARIAAQTAKQVIAQRLHEAEKGAIMDEYAQKVGTVISGAIQRQEGNTYFIDLGRAEGIMPPQEQTRGEYYAPNQRMKFYIKEIRETGRGPEVVVSRSDSELIKGLFATEVPEIQSGAVEIKAIAREAGGRTKLAAISTQDGVDPVGSLVGQKGVRVQAVINEVGEEKIDIIAYSEDPSHFIAQALSPAKDVLVTLDEESKTAKVKIPESQLSLAIGKGGQNVRLAAKLTGWKIDIEGTGEGKKEEETAKEPEGPKESEVKEEGTHEEEKQASEDGGQQSSASQPADDQGQTAVEEIKEEEEKAEENATSKEEEEEAKEAGETLVEAAQGESPKEEEQVLEEAIGENQANIDKATEEASTEGATENEPASEEAAPAKEDAKEDILAEAESTQAQDLSEELDSTEETSPVDTTEIPNVKEEVQAESKE